MSSYVSPHHPFPSLSSLLPSFSSLCCSSTFKDAERASLRDSGHGDSDQADSDQDTNKGSHCDTSAREALMMKAPAVNGQPFEQGEWIRGRQHLHDAFADSPRAPRKPALHVPVCTCMVHKWRGRLVTWWRSKVQRG